VRIERKIRTSVAVLGSLLLAAGGAAPALAGNGAPAKLAHTTGVRLAIANGTSTKSAGWLFRPAAPPTSVTAEFTVPLLRCTTTLSGFAPIASLSTRAGTFDFAAVQTLCEIAAERVTPVLVLNNVETNGSNFLFPGDLVKMTATISATKATVTVQDLTKGDRFTFTKSGPGGTGFGAFVGDNRLETPAHAMVPFVNFGTVTFTNGAVSGKPLGSVTPGKALNKVTAKGVLQILTGPLTGTNKDSFGTTFKHA
jgi:hypothetical protein